MIPPDRLTGWVEWYRFARGCSSTQHEEAVEYANLRSIETENRELLRRNADGRERGSRAALRRRYAPRPRDASR